MGRPPVARRPDLRGTPARADRVAVVVTCRSENVDELPLGLVRLADAEGGGVRIDLTGLDAEGVAELAAAHVGHPLPLDAAGRLQAHTAGNPLHVTALLRELPTEALAGSAPLPAPRSYARLVLARLAGCGEDARRLMAALSVLGLRSTFAVVTDVGEVGDPLSALDEVVAAGLAVVADRPGMREVAVSHPLVRAAIVDDLAPSPWRASTGPGPRPARGGGPGPPHRRHGGPRRCAGRGGPHGRGVRGVGRRPCHSGPSAAGGPGRRARRRPSRPRPAGCCRSPASGGRARGVAHRDRVTALPAGARRDLVLGHLCYVAGPRRDARAHLERAWASIADRPIPRRRGRGTGRRPPGHDRGDRTDGDATRLGPPRPPPGPPVGGGCQPGPHAGDEPRPAWEHRRRDRGADRRARGPRARVDGRRGAGGPAARPRRAADVGGRPHRGGRRPGGLPGQRRWRHARRSGDRPILTRRGALPGRAVGRGPGGRRGGGGHRRRCRPGLHRRVSARGRGLPLAARGDWSPPRRTWRRRPPPPSGRGAGPRACGVRWRRPASPSRRATRPA